MLEFQAHAGGDEALVAQSGLKEAPDVVVAHPERDGVHLEREVSGGLGLGVGVLLAGLGQPLLRGAGEVYGSAAAEP